jgi:hypothetical protein
VSARTAAVFLVRVAGVVAARLEADRANQKSNDPAQQALWSRCTAPFEA